jgi:Bacterial Ig-like domain (group 3)
MRLNLRSTAARAGVLALAGGIVAFTAGIAQAVTPGWVPDPNAAGGLYFYNAAGHQITSGTINDSPLAAYYVASGGGINSGNNKAFQAFSTPVQGSNSATWPGTQTISSTQSFPVALPGDLTGYAGAVVQGVATDGSLNGDQIGAFPNSSAVVGFQNMYEVRVYTTGGAGGQSSTWYSATVQVTGTSWTQVFPAQTSTTTTLTAPATVSSGSNATLHAVVSAGGTGKVEFSDGATVLGTQPVGTDFVVTAPAVGVHSWTARYVPTPGSVFLGSSGTASTAVGAGTTTSFTTADYSPAAPTSVDTITFTAHVTPATAAGTVSFFDGGTTLIGTTGTGAGTFTLAHTLSSGTHSVTATFNPTDPTANGPSTSSPAVSIVVGAAACDGTPNGTTGITCTDVQNITATIPATGTLVVSTPYDSAHALNIPLSLNTAATFFTGSAAFQNILVTDTRNGALPWTLKAVASALNSGANNIDSQNVGLTSLTPASGATVDTSAANFSVTDNPAASPPVAFGAAGSVGLGGGVQHTLAHAIIGTGTVTLNGTLTINAPTNLPAGTYSGTITFTTS